VIHQYFRKSLQAGKIMSAVIRKRSILLLLTTIIAIVLLAGNFTNFKLEPGRPFPAGGGEYKTGSIFAIQSSIKTLQLPLLQGSLGLVFLLLVIYLVANVLFKTNIKRLMIILTIAGIFLALLMLIPPIQPQTIQETFSDSESAGWVSSALYATSPLGHPPRALIWAVVCVVLVLVIGAALYWWQSQKKSATTDEVAIEMEKALNALASGAEFKNVIIECYTSMLRVLHDEAGIERRMDMTPMEFEKSLMSRGLTADSIHQLTRLFEAARYSQDQPDEQDQKKGRALLLDIVAHLKHRKGKLQ
jgi:Zn-dependent protease with chaperone function